MLQAAPAEIRTAVQLPGEGMLNEDRSVRMTPRVAGVVERVAVSQGQSVQAGQVLAVLASPQVAQWRSEAQSAQKRLQLAQANYSREKHLWQEKVSAEQDYLQAQQQKAEAEIAVLSAQAQLSALGAQSTAGLALNQFALRAPFAGVVLEKQLSLGEAVKDDASDWLKERQDDCDERKSVGVRERGGLRGARGRRHGCLVARGGGGRTGGDSHDQASATRGPIIP